MSPRPPLSPRKWLVEYSYVSNPNEPGFFSIVSHLKVRGQRAKGGDPTGLFHESNLKKCTRVGDANEVPVNAIFPIVGHHLSCAELQTTSNSITEGNGSGGFSLKQGELDNDIRDNEIREDVDEHMSSGRIVGKMDCFVGTAIKTAELANDRVAPGGGTPRVIPRSNLASSSPYDATSIHVLSVKEDYLPPRKCSGQEWPSLTEASAIQGTTVSNHLHDTETCRGEKKTFSGSLLKRGIAKGERNTEIPNAGGSSHAPAHGVWPATDGRSQPTNVVIDPGRGNTCRRHGLSSCILCDDFSLHLDRKSSPSNAPQGGESTKPKGGVTVAACAPTGFLDPTGDGNCTTCSLEEHRLSTAGAAVISREEECMPCLPHLLPNCVLCKMQKVRLGRSTSLSALGPTHSGASKTDTPEPSHLRTSKPIARRNDHCEQHDLSDCLPSDNQGSMASVNNSHHRGGRGSIEPLLPGHSPSVFPPRQDLRPSTPPRQIKIFPDHTNHDTSVIAKAGAESAEGPTTVVARNSDDNEDVVTPHHRSRFPPAALRPRRSGISRGMRDNNPAPGDHYACYGRTIGKRHAGDAYAGRNRGERRNHRGNNSLARSRQSSSTNASSRRTGGGRTGAGNSGVRLRESNRDVSDFVTRALMAARAVL